VILTCLVSENLMPWKRADHVIFWKGNNIMYVVNNIEHVIQLNKHYLPVIILQL